MEILEIRVGEPPKFDVKDLQKIGIDEKVVRELGVETIVRKLGLTTDDMIEIQRRAVQLERCKDLYNKKSEAFRERYGDSILMKLAKMKNLNHLLSYGERSFVEKNDADGKFYIRHEMPDLDLGSFDTVEEAYLVQEAFANRFYLRNGV